jgi:type 1 glutamine amidotransferase
MAKAAIDAYFVCGGKYHDIDYARLQLLGLLGEHERIRTRMAEDYRDVAAITAADFLITYTVDILPDEAKSQQLRDYVASGKRWLALHGTNSILRYAKGRGWEAPREAKTFMETLGSQFVAHPAIEPYRVEVTQPEHPLVKGIEPFDADDELYLCELHPPLEVLLHARWTGDAKGFTERDWTRDEPRPVMYLKKVGDMRPLMDEYHQVERGSWKVAAFHELLRRGIRWAARLD